MKILIAIVHYWDPNGSGQHQSLRPDPSPRITALQEQLLSLSRLGKNQSVLHMRDQAIYRANDFYRHDIDINIVTDGKHHVLDLLHPSFTSCFNHIVTNPSDPLHLGFEAQLFMSTKLCGDFDLFCYLEDDLLINDPCFFSKISWFSDLMGPDLVLLPQRIELNSFPHAVDRFFIDGPLNHHDLSKIISTPGPVRLINIAGQNIPFVSPENPHSGCFFLSKPQFDFWISQRYWNDRDTSFVSPLESAATLGISKAFDIYKPAFSHASWLEIQHFGTSFHSLIPL